MGSHSRDPPYLSVGDIPRLYVLHFRGPSGALSSESDFPGDGERRVLPLRDGEPLALPLGDGDATLPFRLLVDFSTLGLVPPTLDPRDLPLFFRRCRSSSELSSSPPLVDDEKDELEAA